MKKVLIALCFMLGFAGMSSAQTAKKKVPTATKIEKAKPADKTAAATTAPMKKDGTADKRFKANKGSKETEAAAGPMKKDGTPDKRFKENKKKKG